MSFATLLPPHFQKNLTAVLDRLKRQEEEAKALQGKNEEFSSLQNQMCILRKDKEKSEKDLQDVRCQVWWRCDGLIFTQFYLST